MIVLQCLYLFAIMKYHAILIFEALTSRVNSLSVALKSEALLQNTESRVWLYEMRQFVLTLMLVLDWCLCITILALYCSWYMRVCVAGMLTVPRT